MENVYVNKVNIQIHNNVIIVIHIVKHVYNKIIVLNVQNQQKEYLLMVYVNVKQDFMNIIINV